MRFINNGLLIDSVPDRGGSHQAHTKLTAGSQQARSRLAAPQRNQACTQHTVIKHHSNATPHRSIYGIYKHTARSQDPDAQRSVYPDAQPRHMIQACRHGTVFNHADLAAGSGARLVAANLRGGESVEKKRGRGRAMSEVM
jgi:hypothetical protein